MISVPHIHCNIIHNSKDRKINLSTEEWIKEIYTHMCMYIFSMYIRVWRYICVYICIHIYIYTHTYLSIPLYTQWSISDMGKEKVLPFCDNLDDPWGYYAKWDKSKKNQYCMILLICGIQKKQNTEKQSVDWCLSGTWGRVWERGDPGPRW